jgi:cell division transport system permease protein
MIPVASRRHGAALFWVVAIACFLAAGAAIAARVSLRAAEAWSEGLRGALTVRIVSPDTQDAVVAAAALLRGSPGIYSARAVTPERAAALLRKWTGPGIASGDLPSLRLIELEVAKAQASPSFAHAVQQALAGANYQAEVYGPGQWAEGSANSAREFSALAVTLAAALSVTALLIAGLAGRARAAADRALITPLADLGATRGQATAPFAARAAAEGFMAGLLGAAAALAVAAWALAHFLPTMPLSDWRRLFALEDAAPVAAAPLLAALLAAAGARTAASRAFSRAARHG